MAAKRDLSGPPARSRRLPGETWAAWTARNAWLRQRANGRWYIEHTEVTEEPGEPVAYRTKATSTGAKDEGAARRFLIQWCKNYTEDSIAASKPAVLTFDALCEMFLTERTVKHLTNSQRYALRRAREFFGDEAADAITEARMDAFHAHLKTRYQPGSIRRWMIVVKAALHHGVRKKLISTNDVPVFDLPADSPPRSYVLSREELARVLTAAGTWGDVVGTQVAHRVGLFVTIAARTAARREAILRLTWERISLAPGRETIDFRDPDYQPKNKKTAVVPVVADLLPMLRRAADMAAKDRLGFPTGPVFPEKRLWWGFHAFTKAQGLPNLTPHVFRHTWATHALEDGMAPAAVAKWMADSLPTIMKTYSHIDVEMLRDAMTTTLSRNHLTHEMRAGGNPI